MSKSIEKEIFNREVESYEQKSERFHANTCTVSIEGQFTKAELEKIFNFVNSLTCSFTVIKGVN